MEITITKTNTAVARRNYYN